jgi:hypothetical protein
LPSRGRTAVALAERDSAGRLIAVVEDLNCNASWDLDGIGLHLDVRGRR